MKVTDEPSQIVAAVVLIVTAGVTTELMVINTLPVIDAEHEVEAELLATTA